MDSERVQAQIWEQALEQLESLSEGQVGASIASQSSPSVLDGMWGDWYSFEYPLGIAAEMVEDQATEAYDEQRV